MGLWKASSHAVVFIIFPKTFNLDRESNGISYKFCFKRCDRSILRIQPALTLVDPQNLVGPTCCLENELK